MARERKDWSTLIRSIRHNRAGNALFYKPVCVIAAVDLADLGRLDSELLHSELIIRRFADYVAPTFPERASNGWQPLWFLANDGLWTFAKKGKLLTRQLFERGTRPRSKEKALDKFDTQAIAPAYQALWEDTARRKELRDQMLLMLADDSESRALIRPLFDPANLTNPDKWPSETHIEVYLRDVRGQHDLFQEAAAEEYVASSRRTASAREALLTFDDKSLPEASPVGPTFDITGVAPVRLRVDEEGKVTQVQADLYQLLVAKCLGLEPLVAAASNRAAHIGPALGALIAALGSGPEQANGYLIWAYGNTLRRLCDADLRSRRSHDPDSPPLPDRIGELLTDLVEQFNVYARIDHLFSTLDHARLGPAGRAELLNELEAGRAIVAAVRNTPGIMEQDATEILDVATQTAEDAKKLPGVNADQAIVNAVEIQRNGAGAILRNALLEVRKVLTKSKGAAKLVLEGALKQVGAEAIKLGPLASLVYAMKDHFVALWQGKTGSDAINYVISLIRDLFS
ncbi:hypothetical protein [Mesorhizobium sp. M0011]|uniref:hypothetical protein n=1 Tax=Mesorhizobium sp. M0011 TaxID=2956839 RepID=UPI00333A0C0C